MKISRKYQKYLEEFGGARALAAVTVQLAIVAAPIAMVLMIALVFCHDKAWGSGLVLATVPLVGVPELESKLNTIETQIKTFIEKAEGEIKATGKVSEETKSALEKQANEAKSIMDRLLAVEQKLVSRVEGEDRRVKSIGEIFVESENFKALAGGAPRSGKVNVGHLHKTALVNATGQNQPLVPAYRVPGIISPATQRLTIRDLFPNIPIASNMIEYVRESSFTNNAALQGADSSPQVYENVAKAESALAFQMLYQPVHTVAHWIPVSRQLLADAPALQGYINSRLLYGLKLKEETELLSGTGVGASIAGLITRATAYNTAQNVQNDTQIDTLRHAGGQVEDSYYPWEFIIINPADWEVIELLKSSSTDEYLISDPRIQNPYRLWGRTVIPTPSMTADYFIVGSSMAATVWDRADATVEVSREHSDFFVRNMAAILCEERVGLTVQIPLALVYGQFPQS